MAKSKPSVSVTPRTLQVIADLCLRVGTGDSRSAYSGAPSTDAEIRQLYVSCLDAHMLIAGYDMPIMAREAPPEHGSQALVDDEERGIKPNLGLSPAEMNEFGKTSQDS